MPKKFKSFVYGKAHWIARAYHEGDFHGDQDVEPEFQVSNPLLGEIESRDVSSDMSAAFQRPPSFPYRAFLQAFLIDELWVEIDAIGSFHRIECNPCRIENSKVLQLSKHAKAEVWGHIQNPVFAVVEFDP